MVTSRRSCLRAMAAAPLAAVVAACGGGGGGGESDPPVQDASTRSWRMGFGGIPPQPVASVVVESIDMWSERAELAAMLPETPWAELLAGADANALIARDHLPLANYYRSKGLKVLVVVELNDGLARGAEAPQLQALGRSLSEPTVQQALRRYAVAVANVLQPDWLCLGAETNLVRLLAPADLYAAVRQSANDAARDVHAAGLTRPPVLFSSVQVETAWGLLPGQSPGFAGIATDYSDFPFSELIGLSSYPYLSFNRPVDIPANWYSRVLAGTSLPAMVVEGGWPSLSIAGHSSSQDIQRAYIDQHAVLLDSIGAIGVVQLYFADLELSTFSQPIPSNLYNFVSLGLTDTDFQPKKALASWDRLFSKTLALAS